MFASCWLASAFPLLDESLSKIRAWAQFFCGHAVSAEIEIGQFQLRLRVSVSNSYPQKMGSHIAIFRDSGAAQVLSSKRKLRVAVVLTRSFIGIASV